MSAAKKELASDRILRDLQSEVDDAEKALRGAPRNRTLQERLKKAVKRHKNFERQIQKGRSLAKKSGIA